MRTTALAGLETANKQEGNTSEMVVERENWIAYQLTKDLKKWWEALKALEIF